MLTRLLLLTLALAGLTLVAGCTSLTPTGGGGLGSRVEYFGPDTLEERIARADVIVRAKLLSASAASERRTDPSTHHIGLVELRFTVLEYLRGRGGRELVALIDDEEIWYNRKGKALDGGQAIHDDRDTRWDDREAVLFLFKVEEALPSTKKADRYWLGSVDGYAIDSRHSRRWLPAATGGIVGASGDDGQRFLLEAPPLPPEGALSGQSDDTTTPSTTLGGLKAMIAAMERAAAASGDAAAYMECLYLKHEWAREALYMKEHYGPFKPGRDYFYTRYDSAIASGLPAGARAFTDPHRAALNIAENTKAVSGDFPIRGKDAGLFTTAWPGVADTVRPLPAGEYRFYYGYRFKAHIICDAEPELEKKREEVFVTVTAPAKTVHEAFFDPAGAAGVPSPAAFTAGGVSTTAQELAWRNGSVTLRLSPFADLAGHALDIIALDGTTALTLDADAAVADRSAGTLTWNVATQPWQAGDTLMLRLRTTGAAPVKPTPTPTPTPTPKPPTSTTTPEISIAPGVGIAEGDSATFTLTASPAPAADLAVSVTVGQSGDYGVFAGSQTVTIGASGTATLTVVTTGDAVDEADGSVTATLNTGTGYTVSASAGAASVLVADDDVPQVSIAGGGGITEGGSATFTLTASPVPYQALTVNVTIGQAGDYGVATGAQTVTMPTTGTATLTVTTTGDDVSEVDGSVTATLNVGNGYIVSTSKGAATVAIADDDVPMVSVKAGGGITEGGSATFTLTASPAPASSLTVNVTVGQKGDYGVTAGAQTVTIDTTGTATLTVATTDDDAYEPDGAVTVTLTTGTGYTVSASKGAATVTVENDDPPPAALVALMDAEIARYTAARDAATGVTKQAWDNMQLRMVDARAAIVDGASNQASRTDVESGKPFGYWYLKGGYDWARNVLKDEKAMDAFAQVMTALGLDTSELEPLE